MTETNASGTSAPRSPRRRKLPFFIGVGALAAAGGLLFLIFSTEPRAERTGATRTTAMLVDTVTVERGDYRPLLVETGTITPAREIRLRPEVGGTVVELGEGFTPGGRVPEGGLLLRIEEADYAFDLRQRKSELRQAEADLKMERGRRDVAEQDFALLGQDVSEANKALVLRQPQLASAKAAVDSARAAVDRAELDLKRTRVRAPFDAQVLERNANLGSQVAPGDDLGRLVGVETYWARVTVPVGKLRWLAFPGDGGGAPSEVRVRNRSAWPEGVYREGRLHKLVGSLEERTRMARVLVTLDDPLSRKPGNEGKPPLLIGEYVEVRMEGKTIPGVVRLGRDYLRKGDTVWVMDGDGKLRIREVKVRAKDARHAYIAAGLEDGEKVVTTNLASVTEGARLREDGAGTREDAAGNETEGTSE